MCEKAPKAALVDTEGKLERLVQTALYSGATNAQIIVTDDIVVDE